MEGLITKFTKWRISGRFKAKTKTFWYPDDSNILGKQFLLKKKKANSLLLLFWKRQNWVYKCYSQYISLKILKFKLWEQNDQF